MIPHFQRNSREPHSWYFVTEKTVAFMFINAMQPAVVACWIMHCTVFEGPLISEHPIRVGYPLFCVFFYRNPMQWNIAKKYCVCF